jgi:hypothetical protein
VSEISVSPHEHSESSSRCLNDCARIGVVADAFATCKPNLRGRDLAGHRVEPLVSLTSSGLICGVCSPAFAE